MEPELDLAGSFIQFDKTPAAFKVAEWPVTEPHLDQIRLLPGILGSEALLDVMIVDMHRRFEHVIADPLHFSPAAPGQEVWIILDPIHQREHLPRRIKNQHGFFHYRHQSAAIKNC